MKIKHCVTLLMVLLMCACAAPAPKKDGAQDRKVTFVDTKDGALMTLPNAILFDVNSYELYPQTKEFFDEIKTQLDLSTGKIKVKGHTDATGKKDKNKILSENRAKSVENELIARGIAPSRIETIGYGSDAPLVANAKTPEEHQKNRRAEILFTQNTVKQLKGESVADKLNEFFGKTGIWIEEKLKNAKELF